MPKYIEKESEVNSFLTRLHYGLEHGAKIQCMMDRERDKERGLQYSNRYTISSLFPDENPVTALKRELLKLTSADYIETVEDDRFPKRSDWRVFGLEYVQGDVYIKTRVELLNSSAFGNHTIFVMSFHYAINPLKDEKFPYRKK